MKKFESITQLINYVVGMDYRFAYVNTEHYVYAKNDRSSVAYADFKNRTVVFKSL